MTATLDLGLGFTEAIERAVVAALAKQAPPPNAPTPADRLAAWRERLWTCAPDTRLFADEVGAALGVSKRTVYRWVDEKHLPCRRRDDGLVFLAGDVRAWADAQEQVVNPATRRGRTS